MPTVRSVHFQPISFLGRYNDIGNGRVTIPYLLKSIEEQMNGLMKSSQFSPGNAEHSHCSFHCDFYRKDNGELKSLKKSGGCCSSKQAMTVVSEKWQSPSEAIDKGDNSILDTSSLDDFLLKRKTQTLSVSGMAFQDVWNIDLQRLKRCYIHEVSQKGTLIPFCAYNLTSEDGVSLYRKQRKVIVMNKSLILENWIAGKIGSSMPITKKELANYQLRKINELLEYLDKSSFYRKRLEGVSSLITLEDIQKLPFTTVDDIITSGTRMVCVSQDNIKKLVTLFTSGTTAKEKRIFFTEEDILSVVDFFHYGLSQFVVKGDKVLVLMPSEQNYSVGNIIKRGVSNIGANIIPHGPVKDLNIAYKNLLDADSIIGTPIQVLALSRYLKNKKIEKNFKGVLVSADNGSSLIYREIEKNFGCKVYNHYGITEAGLGGAVDCTFHQGLHPREADLYFEIIDPETGCVLEDGQNLGGRLFLLPLQDKLCLFYVIERLLSSPCSCHSSFNKLDELRGRLDELKHPISQLFALKEMDNCLFGFDSLIDYEMRVKEQLISIKFSFFLWFIPEEETIRETIEKSFSIEKNHYRLSMEITEGLFYPAFHKSKRQITYLK